MKLAVVVIILELGFLIAQLSIALDLLRGGAL